MRINLWNILLPKLIILWKLKKFWYKNQDGGCWKILFFHFFWFPPKFVIFINSNQQNQKISHEEKFSTILFTQPKLCLFIKLLINSIMSNSSKIKSAYSNLQPQATYANNHLNQTKEKTFVLMYFLPKNKHAT